MKKTIALFLLVILFASLKQDTSLKGTWQFCGSILNSKADMGAKDYTLQRKYTATEYQAYLLEKGEKPYLYEAGDYKLLADTCLETQTFSAQPSKLKGITVRYAYAVKHDTLVLKAKLPN